MADTLLEASNIETFYGPIMAIRGVSFAVPRGAIVTILGANGAGKTTILRTVSGVMDPQKGTVTFQGRPIHGLDPDKVMRRGLAHVPEGREVFPLLTVRENLRMGAFTRRDPAGIAEDLETVYDYFPVLRARAKQRAGSLSGGEQQMLAISRALMARPTMMLLDEPSLGLAPRLVKEIFEIIGRINRERGVTVLLVEQNANMALHIADYGYVLEVGRIVMADTCARLLEKEDIK
ncbi:MAG TPA: ABC transporter ATP-binding protein, partial [Candidatus Limnocylindrales bacterium]|nr:ABC transporter ATP-binding protein [Candidatus Limnocylindrales bacterium]